MAFQIDITQEIAQTKKLNETKEEGIQQGMQQGLELGAQKEKETLAINFLHLGLSLEQVSQGTGLTIEHIKKLKQ